MCDQVFVQDVSQNLDKQLKEAVLHACGSAAGKSAFITRQCLIGLRIATAGWAVRRGERSEGKVVASQGHYSWHGFFFELSWRCEEGIKAGLGQHCCYRDSGTDSSMAASSYWEVPPTALLVEIVTLVLSLRICSTPAGQWRVHGRKPWGLALGEATTEFFLARIWGVWGWNKHWCPVLIDRYTAAVVSVCVAACVG